MIEPVFDFRLLKNGMRERTRLTAYRAVLRIYSSIGLLVGAVAAGYFVARKVDIHVGRQEIAILAAGIAGLMTALISHLVVKILNERDTLRAELYVDAHVFMRILEEWSRFESLASLLMNFDSQRRPTSARLLIHGLVERGVLGPEDAEKLESALFVRNAVAHGRLSMINRSEAEIAASQLGRIVAMLTRITGVSGHTVQQEPSLPLAG